MNEQGSASAIVIAFIIILSIFFLGFASLVQFALFNHKNFLVQQNTRQELKTAAQNVVNMLLEDPTPQADSPYDAIWEKIALMQTADFKVTLQDISSHIGINWVRTEVLEALDKEFHFTIEGLTFSELADYREKIGSQLNIGERYKNYLKEDALNTMFTGYSYFNINLSSVFTLGNIYRIRMQVKNSAAFEQKINNFRTQKEHLDAKVLKSFLGLDYFKLFPIINTNPALNLHFTEKKMVEVLFEYYRLGKEKVAAFYQDGDTVAQEYTDKEIQEILQAIIARKLKEDKKENKYFLDHIKGYLGARTWFWKITVQKDKQTLVWIITRLPRDEEDAEAGAEFHVIEEYFKG